MISTVSVTTLGEPERYKTVLTSCKRAHIVSLYCEMQALLPKSGRQKWVQGKVSPRKKSKWYESIYATWKGESTNPIILLHSCTVTCLYSFWHAICIHVLLLLLLLLLLGTSMYYTVIDYQPLPPLFFPLSHTQEVKPPAPLAMAREWVEDISHVNIVLISYMCISIAIKQNSQALVCYKFPSFSTYCTYWTLYIMIFCRSIVSHIVLTHPEEVQQLARVAA